MHDPDGRARVDPDRQRRHKIQGAFSTQRVDDVATGAADRKAVRKMYWLAEENDDGSVAVRQLGETMAPIGPERSVPREDFLAKYAPEPELYAGRVLPARKKVHEGIVRAEHKRAEGASYSAEFEFQGVLELDEENARATFGLGLTYLDRGDVEKARDVFERIVDLEAAFRPEHKHLFNEFGIGLRKSGLLDQAVDYYRKALDMAADPDENLHYNLARAHFEKGEADMARAHLELALDLNPEHGEARRFLEHLDRIAK